MDTDIELRQIRYFVVVAEELNFTRAAERLQIAQPPLSRQIQNLEKSLQVELFQRTNRRVALTPAGEVFLSECQQILHHVDKSILTTRRADRGEIGRLIIGFEGSFHHQTVLKIIQEFRNQFPDVNLILKEMSSGQQINALHEQSIDVGFIDPIVKSKDISLIQLLAEPLFVVLATSHPLANLDSLNLRQLSQESWITGQHDVGCGLFMRIMESCRQTGFIPNIQQETNDIQMTLGFVSSGLGVTLLPILALESKPSGVIYRSIQPPIPQSELAVAWKRGNTLSSLTLFQNIVQSMF